MSSPLRKSTGQACKRPLSDGAESSTKSKRMLKSPASNKRSCSSTSKPVRPAWGLDRFLRPPEISGSCSNTLTPTITTTVMPEVAKFTSVGVTMSNSVATPMKSGIFVYTEEKNDTLNSIDKIKQETKDDNELQSDAGSSEQSDTGSEKQSDDADSENDEEDEEDPEIITFGCHKEDRNCCLSNAFISLRSQELLIGGVRWPSVDHWFHANKFLPDINTVDDVWAVAARIWKAKTSLDARTIARSEAHRIDNKRWTSQLKLATLQSALAVKFDADMNYELNRMLRRTGNCVLESRTIRDRNWAEDREFSEEHSLGLLLAQVRTHLHDRRRDKCKGPSEQCVVAMATQPWSHHWSHSVQAISIPPPTLSSLSVSPVACQSSLPATTTVQSAQPLHSIEVHIFEPPTVEQIAHTDRLRLAVVRLSMAKEAHEMLDLIPIDKYRHAELMVTCSVPAPVSSDKELPQVLLADLLRTLKEQKQSMLTSRNLNHIGTIIVLPDTEHAWGRTARGHWVFVRHWFSEPESDVESEEDYAKRKASEVEDAMKQHRMEMATMRQARSSTSCSAYEHPAMAASVIALKPSPSRAAVTAAPISVPSRGGAMHPFFQYRMETSATKHAH